MRKFVGIYFELSWMAPSSQFQNYTLDTALLLFFDKSIIWCGLIASRFFTKKKRFPKRRNGATLSGLVSR